MDFKHDYHHDQHHDRDHHHRPPKPDLTLPDRCCTATTGCQWDGTLRKGKSRTNLCTKSI